MRAREMETTSMQFRDVIRQWRVKGLIQQFLSLMPAGERINDRLQSTVGDLRNFEGNIGLKVSDWTGIMAYLREVRRNNLEGQTVLEIGTGWYPTLPVCFALAGARCIYTVDLTPHLNAQQTLRMLNALEPQLGRIAEFSGRQPAAVEQTYEQLRKAGNLKRLLEVANIRYHAPQDAANLDWMPAGSVDIVYSNSVFEHVVPSVIPVIMREAWRVLQNNGLMVHAVACNDHYAHFDKRISFINYLQYSDRQWRLWNNRLNYQNRLRAPEFIKFAKDCGFRILHEARAIRPGTREALSKIRLAPEFTGYSPDDLAATTVDFVAAKTVQ
jgi:SAM-dependent methyltransferase